MNDDQGRKGGRCTVLLILGVLSGFRSAALMGQEVVHGEAAGIEDAVEIESVTRIWDRAPHNAFTDLIRFDDSWYCIFREGEKHVSPDGQLRLIRSDDGVHWETAAVFARKNGDVRDGKLSITPDGQLMVLGAEALHDRSRQSHQSLAWFSADGDVFSEAYPVGDPDYWLWRVSWHQGTGFGFGYHTGGQPPRDIRLYRTSDGRRFDRIREGVVDVGYPNESEIIWTSSGQAICLLRRDGTPSTALLGKASAPFEDWAWQDLGNRVGGPALIQLPDHRVIAVVRLYTPRVRTAVCELDPATLDFKELCSLPSGGDTSYAGLVWHAERLWVSYYSSHEEPESGASSSIYLARLRFSAGAGDR